MPKANNTEAEVNSEVNAVIRHHLQTCEVFADVLKVVLPVDVYKDWMVLSQAIDVSPLLMFGCE